MTEPGERASFAAEDVSECSGSAAGNDARLSPRPFRRFLRFNLVTALGLLLCVSAYFGVRQQFAVSREEVAAKESLAQIGGRYVTRPTGSAWLRNGLMLHDDRFQYVEELTFAPEHPEWGYEGPDDSLLRRDRLAALSHMPRLRSIDFYTKVIGDETLACLASCTNIERIDWNFVRINDAGVDRLRRLPKLQSVNLQRTFTSDLSLETLADMPELTSIALDDATTSRGIEALLRYPKLKDVDATATSLRPQDVQPLVDRGIRVALPTPIGTSHDDAEKPIVYSWVRAWRGRAKPLRIDVSPAARFDEAFLESVDPRFASIDLHFTGVQRVPDETLALAVRDPRIVSIELPACGFPYRQEEIRELLALRPTEARVCRVYGHVLISGSELLGAAQRGFGSTHHVVYEVPEDLVEPLSAVGVTLAGDRMEPGTGFEQGSDGLLVPVEPDA